MKGTSNSTNSQASLFLLHHLLLLLPLLVSRASASSNLGKSLVPDVHSRHYSVNPTDNTVLACGSLIDIRYLNRMSHCFISLSSTKGYWLNLGDLFSRVLGYDSDSNYFILRDRQDKFFMLTRDGTHYHPINSKDGIDIMSRDSFVPSVSATTTSSTNTNGNTLLALSLIKQGTSKKEEGEKESQDKMDHSTNNNSINGNKSHKQQRSEEEEEKSSSSPEDEKNLVIDLLDSAWRSQMDFLISNENKVVSVWM